MKDVADRLFAKLIELQISKGKYRVNLTTVFHVEKLYCDKYFHELALFCKDYKDLTKCQAVLTCMTPHSPILRRQMEAINFRSEVYWERIRELKKIGLIGLHGHYVRGLRESGDYEPMHFSFYDNKKISDQIELETRSLIEEGVARENELIYSGGWWFTCDNIRSTLLEKGFTWDYSVSSSLVNRSPGSDALNTPQADAAEPGKDVTKHLKGSIAVSSISKKDRPFHAFHKIWKNGRQTEGRVNQASLYSHDYDLHRSSAIAFVNRALDIGIEFDQPQFVMPMGGVGTR